MAEMGMKGMLWLPDVSVWERAAMAAEPVQGEKVLLRNTVKFRGVTARDQVSFLCIRGGMPPRVPTAQWGWEAVEGPCGE